MSPDVQARAHVPARARPPACHGPRRPATRGPGRASVWSRQVVFHVHSPSRLFLIKLPILSASAQIASRLRPPSYHPSRWTVGSDGLRSGVDYTCCGSATQEPRPARPGPLVVAGMSFGDPIQVGSDSTFASRRYRMLASCLAL